jgi:hypothetical protein
MILAFKDEAEVFVDRTADVCAAGFLRIYGFLHISIYITPKTIQTGIIANEIFKTSIRKY